MVLSVFMVTYVPALVMLNITQYCLKCSCHVRFNLYVLRYILLVSNSAVNPFIYTMRIKDFRNSLKSMFCEKLKKIKMDSDYMMKRRELYVPLISND